VQQFDTHFSWHDNAASADEPGATSIAAANKNIKGRKTFLITSPP